MMRQISALLAAVGVGGFLSGLLLVTFTFMQPAAVTAGPLPARPAPLRARMWQPSAPVSAVITSSVSFSDVEVVASAVTTPDLDEFARGLAQAMDISPSLLISAALVCDGPSGRCSDPSGMAILGMAPGTWFPTRGPSFTLLSTGLATDVATSEVMTPAANHEGLETLRGLTNTLGGDVVRLRITLDVPLDAKCLAFDYAFYTMDIPTPDNACEENLGDLFTTQFNASALSVARQGVHTSVDAPGNFVFNQQGQMVATNTMSPTDISRAITSPLGTTIPGIFPLLQARHKVTGGEPVELYFSIQDMGDALANSAVALDNFHWISDATAICQGQTAWSGDQDGDGLPDGWEVHGKYAHDITGTLQYLDLAAFGADPTVKDVFVEIDAMTPLPGGDFEDAFDPKPYPEAIAKIVEAFAHAPVDPLSSTEPLTYQGIRLHVDYGKDAPLLRAGITASVPLTWAEHGRGEILPETMTKDYLCGDLCSTGVEPVFHKAEEIKHQHFDAARSAVFHYGLFIHMLAACTAPLHGVNVELCNKAPDISGISSNITDTVHGASDFIVSLGGPRWANEPEIMIDQQAGTFMHELGHNLGLNHFGTIAETDVDRVMFKPQHLSVMNYLYQSTGLVVTDSHKFDYLRYPMPPLDETQLDESIGISYRELGITYTLGSRHHCGFVEDSEAVTVTMDASGVNWNCNETLTDTQLVSYNISGDYVITVVNGITQRVGVYTTLVVTTEWDRLSFTGGLLNRQRSILPPPVAVRDTLCEVEVSDLTQAQQITRVEVMPQLKIAPNLEEMIDGELTAKVNAQILRDAPPLLFPKGLDPGTLVPLNLYLDPIPIWYPGDLMPGINALLELILPERHLAHP